MTPPELSAIPYLQFLADVDALAQALAADSWRPDYLVGIGRGGLVPATYLSHRTGVPLLSVDLGTGLSAFGDGLLAPLSALCAAGTRMLLVDDINDSGGTLLSMQHALAGAPADTVRTAVLLDNIRSVAPADYRARTIDRATDKRWFVFPWEAVAPRDTLVADAAALPARLA